MVAFAAQAAILIGLGLSSPARAETPPPVDMPKLCTEIDAKIKRWGWKGTLCEAGPRAVEWKFEHRSVKGRPLIYAEFGSKDSKNVTLILSMIHPDEITPLYISMMLARWLKENEGTMGDSRVVFAPLVNPDGMVIAPATRTNANGVDVNRNFATKDWAASALSAWKKKFKADPRRYPGSAARSEPETVFQEWLVETMQPKKILSIHSPLNHMDYDGPSDLALDRFSEEYVKECEKLRARLKAKSTGYFVGSLGNFAGQERGIPTITLELPTSDRKQADNYWKRFQAGIRSMIDYKIESTVGRDGAAVKSRAISAVP